MNDAVSEPPLELSYPITYQVFAGSSYNQDFTGKGRLTIRAARPSFIFQGRPRRLFSRRQTELEFGPDDIWNVVVTGRSISFHTQLGKGGKSKTPFIFFCPNAEDARQVATLLPTRLDQDFTANQEFTARLNALADARSPWSSATNIIITLNVLFYVIMGCLGAGWFTVESMDPYMLFGANNGAATTNGEWWRLLTSMFVHFGLMHLVLNMWALYQAGHFLEKLQGRWIYTLTYLGSGLAGGLLSIAVHGDKVWSAGASGAIFGVYGAILGYMLREKQALPRGIYKPMMKSTLSFAAYNILYGMKAGVDNSAHIGGVLGGFALGWLLALPVNAEIRQQQTRKKLQLGLAAVALLVAAGVMLTPRFDYAVADEIKWDRATKDSIPKETELLQQNLAGLVAVEKGTDGTAHAAWMESTLVPFYRSWDDRISALTLVAGRRTARRRDILDKIFRMRVDEYGRLIGELRTHEPEALAHYVKSEGVVSEEFEKLKKE